jgi:hypothetical protein
MTTGHLKRMFSIISVNYVTLKTKNITTPEHN